MIQFDPHISPLLIIGWLAAVGIAAFLVYMRQRRVLRKRDLTGLIGVRCIGSLLLAILLLQPFTRTETPDADEFVVLLLADCSGSMQIRDCRDGAARLDVVANALDADADDSLVARLHRRYNVETFLFSDELHRHTGGPVPVLPGMTAVGASLRQALAMYGRRTGAVVLLSDGQSNTGESLVEAARAAARAGIPVTTVGIGEPGGIAGLTVSGPPTAVRTAQRQPTGIPVTVSSTHATAQETGVSLYRGDTLVQRRNLSLPPGPVSRELTFEIEPFEAGIHTYRVHVDGPRDAVRPENNIAYVAVEVQPPPTYRVLYLSGELNREYRFLRHLAQRSERLELAGIIRLTDEVHHTVGELPDGFDGLGTLPETLEAFQAFDVLVLDASAAELLPAAVLEVIGQFAAARGGGVLLTGGGSTSSLPAGMIAYLPMSATRARVPRRTAFLEVQSGLVFPETAASGLLAAPGPYLPDGNVVQFAHELKPAARIVLATVEQGDPVLVVQPYGGGRTAYLGTGATWRWHLASDDDRDRHEAFWTNLLAWLAAGGKPRLDPRFEGRQYAVNESTLFEVAVRDSEFEPAVNADVRMVVAAPDGSLTELPMPLSADAPGIYSAWFAPPDAGEYRVSIRAELPNEPVLHRDAYFLSVHGGAEYASVEYREDVLRDAARISRGDFVHYRGIGRLDQLKLADAVPTKPAQSFWTMSWVFALLLLGSFLAEWYLRRRIGLK